MGKIRAFYQRHSVAGPVGTILVLWGFIERILDWVGLVDQAKSMMDPHHWLTQVILWPHLELVISAIGIVLLTFLIVKEKPATQREHDRQASGPVGTIRLADAALRALNETQTLPIADIAERVGRDNVLAYYAQYLAEGSKLFGIRAPATEHKPLAVDLAQFAIMDNGDTLMSFSTSETYQDLRIREGDFSRIFAEMKRETDSEPVRAKPEQTTAAESVPLYTDALDVFNYLKDDSDWRVRMNEKYKKEGTRLMEMIPYMVAAEFKRAAADGAIEVLGRKAGRGSHELIPTVYWLKASLALDSRISKRGVKTDVGLERLMDGIPIYTELQVISSGVYKEWPPATQ